MSRHWLQKREPETLQAKNLENHIERTINTSRSIGIFYIISQQNSVAKSTFFLWNWVNLTLLPRIVFPSPRVETTSLGTPPQNAIGLVLSRNWAGFGVGIGWVLLWTPGNPVTEADVAPLKYKQKEKCLPYKIALQKLGKGNVAPQCHFTHLRPLYPYWRVKDTRTQTAKISKPESLKDKIQQIQTIRSILLTTAQFNSYRTRHEKWQKKSAVIVLYLYSTV